MRTVTRFSALASVFGFVAAASAQTSAMEALNQFGTFSQLNSAVTDPTTFNGLRGEACVPTSVANGLQFLSNFYGLPASGCNLMLPGYGTVNTLASAPFMATQPDSSAGAGDGGTTYANMIAGTTTYIGPNPGRNVSPPVGIAGNQANPTSAQLLTWLNANDAIEFWIQWTNSTGTTTGGAHSLTLYQLTVNAAGNGGSLMFIDPYGGTVNTAGASAVSISTATWTTLNGLMFINGGYTGGAAVAADPDNPGRTSYGYIRNDLAEMVTTPEPSSLVLFGVGALVLVSRRRRSKS